METMHHWANDVNMLLKAPIILAGFILIMFATDYIFKLLILRNKNKDEVDINGDGEVNEADARLMREGYIIGKCENLIILIFVLAGALTGLSLIFAAKSLARRKDIDNNAGFFLVGTLVNFTSTLILAYILKFSLELLFN